MDDIDELVEELEELGDQLAYVTSKPAYMTQDMQTPQEIKETALRLLLEYINDGRVMSAFNRIFD